MFGIAPSELMVVALVALVLIGPQDLPRALRLAGRWIGKGKAMSRHLRGTVDEFIRQTEACEQQSSKVAVAPASAISVATTSASESIAAASPSRPN